VNFTFPCPIRVQDIQRRILLGAGFLRTECSQISKWFLFPSFCRRDREFFSNSQFEDW
jgi:hypothetical protein